MSFSVYNGFRDLCFNLRFTDSELDTIRYRYHAITLRVNKDYYSSESDTSHSLYVGSYGRSTEISSSDIDMLVELPNSVYWKYNDYSGNGQSALLQDVKNVLSKTYSNSVVKADGQIISIDFADGINFEVLPAFLNKDGESFTFANTNAGGSWKVTNPRAEIKAVKDLNDESNGNYRRLCRMAREWRDYNNVDISGILIDILAYNFIRDWKYKKNSFTYYDWMTRDFFKYVSNVPVTQSSWKVMGSNRFITCNGYFQNKAKDAYNISLEAISDEKEYPYVANKEWRQIYGKRFPLL